MSTKYSTYIIGPVSHCHTTLRSKPQVPIKLLSHFINFKANNVLNNIVHDSFDLKWAQIFLQNSNSNLTIKKGLARNCKYFLLCPNILFFSNQKSSFETKLKITSGKIVQHF